MSVRISRSVDRQSGKAILRVEGSLTPDAAELLKDICIDFIKRFRTDLIIDVAGIDFLSEDGALALRELKQQKGISFEGCRLFTQRVIESGVPV